jgi:hypothetical protein
MSSEDDEMERLIRACADTSQAAYAGMREREEAWRVEFERRQAIYGPAWDQIMRLALEQS